VALAGLERQPEALALARTSSPLSELNNTLQLDHSNAITPSPPTSRQNLTKRCRLLNEQSKTQSSKPKGKLAKQFDCLPADGDYRQEALARRSGIDKRLVRPVSHIGHPNVSLIKPNSSHTYFKSTGACLKGLSK